MRYATVLILLFAPIVAFAQENDAAKVSYCKFIAEQAMAQRDILRTPALALGPVSPNTGTPPQMVWGVTNSLVNDHKAGLTMKAAHTQCELYSAATEAQLHLFYALPGIEKEVLRHRLDLIQQATSNLDNLLAEDMKLVNAQNLTRTAVYHLQGARIRLDMTRTQTLTGIATPYVPELSSTPLHILVGEKMQAEGANQKAQARLEKQNGWDIQVGGGVRKTIYPGSSIHNSFGGFGEFSLTYNLGRKAANSHIEKSTDAYIDWKRDQFDDVVRQAAILKEQVEETITINAGQLKVLQAHNAEIQKDLDSLVGAETNTALTFRDQLLADQVVLRVDIGDVEFRLARLKQYLADNF
jgi:hypothetical protein